MSRTYSEQDRYDLKEMFRIYDFSKVEKVNSVVAEAEEKGTSPTQLFDSLYTLYKIQRLPQRDAVAKRLHMAVSTASDADVESVLRQTEMKGFSERDAVRTLERKFSIHHVNTRSLQAARSNLNAVSDSTTEESTELMRTTSQLRHVTVNENSMSGLAGRSSLDAVANDENGDEASVVFARPPSHLSAAPTRENLDEIIAEEVREWLAKMLGAAHNADVLAMPNFIDALRNGVLLHVLLQKMCDPPVPDAELKLPKRATGFFIRDNVATFLKEAKSRFHLVDAQLFTDSDLVDGKSDRQVVTCLMAMARIAYSAGTIQFAPNIIMYEHEIEQQANRLSKTDLDRIVKEAEAKEGQEEVDGEGPIPLPRGEGEAPEKEEASGQSCEAPVEETQEVTAETAAEVKDEENDAASAQEANKTKEEGEAPAADEVQATSPISAVSDEATVDQVASPPPFAADRTASPTPSAKTSRAQSATPQRTPAAAPSPPPAAETKKEEEEARSRESPKPQSEDLHTPQERGMSPGDATQSASKSKNKNDVEEDGAEDGDDDDNTSSGGGGRVFYLRDGMLRPTKPTAAEESELLEQRKKSAPRVVWKSPSSPLAATKPPRYHSRHWDGIDIALSRHLNEHYEENPQSPWRFHMVASTSGEYVLYNRQNAQKRVVYLRLIQTRLFLRNAGKNQPWVRIDEALAALESSA